MRKVTEAMSETEETKLWCSKNGQDESGGGSLTIIKFFIGLIYFFCLCFQFSLDLKQRKQVELEEKETLLILPIPIPLSFFRVFIFTGL